MDLIEKLGLSVFPHSKPFPEGEGLVPLSLGGAEWRFLNGRFRFGHEKGATKCRTVGTVRVATLQALSIISECLKMRTRLSVIYVALFGVLASPLASASCGSSACSVNTNWDEHSASQPGLSIDLRYSSTKLDQLRSGSNKITAEDPADPALTPGEEVENLYTKSQLVTATVDYTFDETGVLSCSCLMCCAHINTRSPIPRLLSKPSVHQRWAISRRWGAIALR